MEKEIKFVRYNDCSINHREIIDKLNNDLSSRTYLGSNLYDNIANNIRLSEENEIRSTYTGCIRRSVTRLSRSFTRSFKKFVVRSICLFA